MKRTSVLLGLTAIWAAGDCLAQAPAAGNASRTLVPYFTPAARVPKAPDADGFLQRWMLLEPINKPNRTNTVFTDTYVRSALNNAAASGRPRHRPIPTCRSGRLQRSQRLYDVLQSWPVSNIDLRIGDYMMRPHQKWTITPVTSAGGYPGSPYFKIQIADTDRTLAAAAGNEVVTVPNYAGAQEQLWRIDQLTDGTYRIMPKAVPNSTEPVALIAVGASTPTLARFDPKSEKGCWTFRKP